MHFIILMLLGVVVWEPHTGVWERCSIKLREIVSVATTKLKNMGAFQVMTLEGVIVLTSSCAGTYILHLYIFWKLTLIPYG
jgi:hypothetical protein